MDELRAKQLQGGARRAFVSWLSQVEWDWFGTFAFTRAIRNGTEERRYLWNDFLRSLMARHRDTVGYVWVEEQRHATDSLAEVGIHYHALLVSNRPVDESLMRTLWMSLAGNGARKGHASVFVQPYKPQLGGIDYTLKLLDREDVTWDIGNVEYFLPDRPEGWDRDRYSRRRFRRDLGRKQAAILDAMMPENGELAESILL
jgi:hypothetical protein